MTPFSRETIIDRRQPQMRWSAVIAGTVLSLGLWILLQTIGTGLGLSAVDTNDAGSLRGVGIGTGIWSVIAPLIALFVGAMLAGRLASTREPRVGAMHGSVHWALTAVLGAYLVVSMIGALASGLSRAGNAAVDVGSRAVAQSGGIMDELGLDRDDVVAPINERLRAQGKSEITADEIERSLRATAQRGVREGRLDREMLSQELARNTGLSRAEVDDLAQQLEARNPQIVQLGNRAENVALEAADRTGKGLALAGLALLLGLAASVGGGALGARLAARHDEKRDRETPIVPPTSPTTTTTGMTGVDMQSDRLA